MVPFIKWVGGKRQLIHELAKRLPTKFNTYYEPFVGGGALLYYLKPLKAYISDLNQELITTYQALSQTPQLVLELLILMEQVHSEETYKRVALLERMNSQLVRGITFQTFSKQLKAARFIYLNKACFNGLYRVNAAGYFNVPWNQKSDLKTFDAQNITEVVQYFQTHQIQFSALDFAVALQGAAPGDFVYLDPPYDYEIGQKGFASYQKNGFSQKEQLRLAKLCQTLDAKGVKFMLSNHDTRLVRHLYQQFDIEVVKARRMINSQGHKRGWVNEVIVRNYVS